MSDHDKLYIGDAIYADVDKWGALILTTEDGITETNRIVLEPRELASLERYIESMRVRARALEKRS